MDFENPIDLIEYMEPENYPPPHVLKFKDINALGKTRFEAWERTILSNKRRCKGDLELRRRVFDLVEKGRRLNREENSEMSWRLELEPLVFKRFFSGVQCRICKKRIWCTRLNAPRKVTPLCRCDANELDGGIPNVDEFFDIRAEFNVNVGDSQKAQLQRPDNVIGLRLTGELFEQLRKEDPREESRQTLWQSLQPTLSLKKTRPVTCPFLVAEAKSHHAAGMIQGNFKQISKTIGKSLDIQAKLYDALGEGVWKEGPLVWAVVNKGPRWTVAAVYPRYVKGKCSTLNHPCVCLWEGSIHLFDEAVQLLLIMDYIYEWARGYYRPTLIDGLKQLAQKSGDDPEYISDLPSIAAFTVESDHLMEGLDEVAAAMLNKAMNIKLEKNNTDTPANNQESNEPHIPDSTYAVYRCAANVNSRYLSVLITMKFLQNVRRCEPPDSASPILGVLHQILYNATQCIDGQHLFLKRCDINNIEYAWTKERRGLLEGEDSQEIFLSLPTFTAYFGPDWILTRELSIVGISIPVVQELLLAQRVPHMLGIGDEMPRAQLDPFMQITQDFLRTTPHAMVAACINGSCIVPSQVSLSTHSTNGEDSQYLMRESNAKWRTFAWSIHQARLDCEALGDYIQDSELLLLDQAGPKDLKSPCLDSSPWADTSIITPRAQMILIYSPPADPFREVMGPADAAMYCLYSLRQDTRSLVEDLIFGRIAFPGECLNSERMTGDMKKKMRWNRMHNSKWSTGLISEIAQQHLRVLQKSMWKSLGI